MWAFLFRKQGAFEIFECESWRYSVSLRLNSEISDPERERGSQDFCFLFDGRENKAGRQYHHLIWAAKVLNNPPHSICHQMTVFRLHTV